MFLKWALLVAEVNEKLTTDSLPGFIQNDICSESIPILLT